jgi:hypothetical protein
MTKPKVTEGKISDLIPDDRNANKGTERGRYMIERSLTTLGAGRSIVVDKNGKIIGGNKTTEAAFESGIEDAIFIETDGSKLIVHKRIDLDLDEDEKARQLAIADNRTSEVSYAPDAEILAELSQEIDLTDYYSEEEIDNLLKDINQDNGKLFGGGAPPDDNKEIDEDKLGETKHTCPSCGFKY